MKIIQVKTNPVNISALVSAAIAGDEAEVAAILDDALEFRGVGGAIVERVDGPIFEELAGLLRQAIDEALNRAMG